MYALASSIHGIINRHSHFGQAWKCRSSWNGKTFELYGDQSLLIYVLLQFLGSLSLPMRFKRSKHWLRYTKFYKKGIQLQSRKHSPILHGWIHWHEAFLATVSEVRRAWEDKLRTLPICPYAGANLKFVPGYGPLLREYVYFLLAKLSFHRQHPEFNGAWSFLSTSICLYTSGLFEYEEYISLKTINDPNEG